MPPVFAASHSFTNGIRVLFPTRPALNVSQDLRTHEVQESGRQVVHFE